MNGCPAILAAAFAEGPLPGVLAALDPVLPGLGEGLRLLLPILPAAVVAWWVDRASYHRGLIPPREQEGSTPEGHALRRAAAATLLAVVLYLGVMAPLFFLDRLAEIEVVHLSWSDLFVVHILLLLALAGWFGLHFGGRLFQELRRQCRIALHPPWVLKEVLLGLLWGAAAWMVAVGLTVAASLVFGAPSGPGEEALPPMILALAALPWWLRLAVAVSAGVVEELFFRGFLQRRLGIAASGVLFVLPHMAYQEPPMLVGVAALSLIFAFLVRIRGDLWAAIVAHTAFDAVQLLVVVPAVLEVTAGVPPGS